MSSSQDNLTFLNRVDNFWNEFGKNLGTIEKHLRNKNFMTANKIMEQYLKLCLIDQKFKISLIGDKVDLMLRTESIKEKLLWLKFMKSRMPKELELKLTLTIGNVPDSNASIVVNRTRINAKDFISYTKFNDKSVSIYIYNNAINRFAEEEEDDYEAELLSYAICEKVLGEMTMINVVESVSICYEPSEEDMKDDDEDYEEIKNDDEDEEVEDDIFDEIPKENAIALNELGAIIVEKFGKEILSDTFNKFESYKQEPSANALRKDIYNGRTLLYDLCCEYINKQKYTYEDGLEYGINFCFLALPYNGDIKHSIDYRDKIEKELQESNFCMVIGTAEGKTYTYIDLCCYDKNELAKAVDKIRKDLEINIELCEFKPWTFFGFLFGLFGDK